MRSPVCADIVTARGDQVGIVYGVDNVNIAVDAVCVAVQDNGVSGRCVCSLGHVGPGLQGVSRCTCSTSTAVNHQDMRMEV